MSCNRIVFSALLAGIILSAALVEHAVAQAPIRPVPPIAKPTPGPRQEPCWEVAGVSKSAIEQRQAIARQARQEVEAVCSNSSLSIQQKRQQIQQIHQQEREQIDAIITTEQREAMRSCQEQRNPPHAGGHAGGGHAGGPCGEMPTGHEPNPPQKPNPPQEDEAPPN